MVFVELNKRRIHYHEKIIAVLFVFIFILTCCGCGIVSAGGSEQDVINTKIAANNIQTNQPTPVDLNYSLERYNLIRRAYWVNGQREKANALICEVEKPLGYAVLFAGNVAVGSFVVDGKVSSLTSYLTPDSEYYELVGAGNGNFTHYNNWLADVDGAYGENLNGVFFFTPDGKYIEWNGYCLYSDIPFEIDNPVVSYKVVEKTF